VVAVAPPAVAIGAATGLTGATDRPGRRDFVEVDRSPTPTRLAATTAPLSDGGPEVGDATPASPVISAGAAEPGWNLWGDLDA
jgi:hypothetical protein